MHLPPLAILPTNPLELILLLAVLFLLFGTGKLKDLAKGIKDFKREMNRDDEEADDEVDLSPRKKKPKAILAGGEDDEEDETEAEHEPARR